MANNRIQVKRTSTSGRTPNTTNSGNSQYIAAGELALNMTDGILYSSNGSAVIEVGANNTNQRVTGTLTINSVSANGSLGTNGFILFSNGTSTYWASPTYGSLNYAQNTAPSTWANNQTGTVTLAQISITTSGNPVQIIASGDANPLNTGGWGRLQLWRGSTAIGSQTHFESSNANENVPYSLQFIDNPGTPGTYTYSLRSNYVTGNTQFGETDGPVISVVELQNVKGANGDANTARSYIWTNTHSFGNLVSIQNDKKLAFIPNAGGANQYFTAQSDDNFVFYTTSSINEPRPVWSIFAASDTSALSVATPLTLSGNLTLGTVAVSANGSTGTSGQVLTTNGSSAYWTAPTFTINTAASYSWSNVHTFGANVAITAAALGLSTNTTAIYFNGTGDANWKMGRNTGAFTKWRYTNNSVDIAIANSNLEGFTIGNAINPGNSFFETGFLGTFIASNVTIGNTSVNATINSTAFSGSANNTTYVNGKTEAALNVNSASYANASVTNTFTVGTGTYFVSNGNVGIGTSTPGGKLDVRNGTIEFDPGVVTDATRAFNFNIGGSNYGKILVPSGSGGAMAFWTGSANAAVESMRIAANGNVGIGNTAPAHKLRVTGTTSLAGAVSDITTLAAGNTTITGFSNVTSDGQFAGNVGIGIAPSSTTGFYISKSIGSDAQIIGQLVNLTDGNTAMTANRSKYGYFGQMFITNQNKSADGLTSYSAGYEGIHSDVYNGSSVTGGDATAATINGANFRVLQYANGANANTIGTVRGVLAQINQLGSGVINQAYIFNGSVGANSTVVGNIGNAYGVSVAINPGAAMTVNTGYLYYGSYSGTTTNTKYGVYITGESYNYFSANVGIGNTAPAHDLRVEGTTSLAGAVSDITTLAAGNTTITGFVNAVGASASVSVGANVNIDTAKASFGTASTTNAPQVIVANTSGTLTVNTATLSIVTASTGRALLATDSGGSLSLGRTDSAASFPYIDFNSGATTVDYDVRMMAGGGSGVSGGGTLTVTAANLAATGVVTAVDFNSTSDVRYKSNIIIIDNALDKVKQLNGYTFTMNETGDKSTGLIAQEVEKVLPEAVKGTDKKTLSYGNMIGLLVEAIKEQNKKIEQLEDQINILRK